MAPVPEIFYFLSSSESPVTSSSPFWGKVLPLTREHKKVFTPTETDEEFCYGDYFKAARAFIESDDYSVIRQAIHLQSKREIKTKNIKAIDIYLEKHGEFYHPARIVVTLDGQDLAFMLNMAISDTGKAHIDNEYRHLKRLNSEFPYDYLPCVYGTGRIRTRRKKEINMFLGNWFEGFYEFHLSIDEKDHRQKMNIWGETGVSLSLSDEQVLSLYAQASHILTLYYNAVTFEHIASWHHAAGDFIVRIENKQLALKLITVRRYESLFRIEDQKEALAPNTQSIMNAMLIFLLNLLIRMRLDRRDGIGEILWADDVAVNGALTGFLAALTLKPEIPCLPDTVSACFRCYLSSCTSTDLLDLSRQILYKTIPNTPEFFIAKRHLNNHIHVLSKAIHQMI